MRLRVFVLALLAFVASASNAGVLYSWSADCLSRIYSVGPVSTPLGCSGPLRGTLTMPDGYVPGTVYGSPFPTVDFVIFDDFSPSGFRRHLAQASIIMPATVGTPLWDLSDSAMISRASAAGFTYGVDFIGSGFNATGQNIVAQLVSEPASIALVGICLLAMLASRYGRRRG